jgi:hypothetical protein
MPCFSSLRHDRLSWLRFVVRQRALCLHRIFVASRKRVSEKYEFSIRGSLLILCFVDVTTFRRVDVCAVANERKRTVDGADVRTVASISEDERLSRHNSTHRLARCLNGNPNSRPEVHEFKQIRACCVVRNTVVADWSL